MIYFLSKIHRITRRATLWFGIFVGLLGLIAVVMLINGNLNMDVDLFGWENLNPYLAVVGVVVALAVVFYLIVFALAVPIVYLRELLQNNNKNSEH